MAACCLTFYVHGWAHRLRLWWSFCLFQFLCFNLGRFGLLQHQRRWLGQIQLYKMFQTMSRGKAEFQVHYH